MSEQTHLQIQQAYEYDFVQIEIVSFYFSFKKITAHEMPALC